MILIPYGVESTIEFPLYTFGSTSYITADPSFAAGDSKKIVNGASDGNTTNLPTYVANGYCKIVLTAAEAQCKRLIITIIDQTALKVWEDQSINIFTYGNANAHIIFNMNSNDYLTRTAYVDFFNKEVTTRNASNKPTSMTVGTALNQITVNTTYSLDHANEETVV